MSAEKVRLMAESIGTPAAPLPGIVETTVGAEEDEVVKLKV
jgi:hypothetical protein